MVLHTGTRKHTVIRLMIHLVKVKRRCFWNERLHRLIHFQLGKNNLIHGFIRDSGFNVCSAAGGDPNILFGNPRA